MELNGVNYLIDPNTGDLYDYAKYTEHEETVMVGNYNPATKSLTLTSVAPTAEDGSGGEVEVGWKGQYSQWGEIENIVAEATSKIMDARAEETSSISFSSSSSSSSEDDNDDADDEVDNHAAASGGDGKEDGNDGRKASGQTPGRKKKRIYSYSVLQEFEDLVGWECPVKTDKFMAWWNGFTDKVRGKCCDDNT